MSNTADSFDVNALLQTCLRAHLVRMNDGTVDEATSEPGHQPGTTAKLGDVTDTDRLCAAGKESETRKRSLAAAFALGIPDVPRAASLSPTEIAAAMARREDPHADGECYPASAPETPIGATAARMAGFLAELANPEVRARFAEPGLVLVQVPGSYGVQAKWQAVIASVLDSLSARLPKMVGDAPHVVDILEARTTGSYRSADAKPLPPTSSAALARGRTAVVIGAYEDVPDTVLPFLDEPVTPGPLTRDHVCAILQVTHSWTGQIAEEAVRDRLPSDTALARIPGLALDAAFSERTTLRVANALSRFAARTAPAEAPPVVTLDRVRGLASQAREELAAVLCDLRAWQAGELPWSDVPASLLLAGPPGTGKTMIARALAGELGWTLIETSFSDCQSRDAGHLGTTLRHMRQHFEEAEREAPAILFFDELDSLRDRGAGTDGRQGDRYMAEIVNGMLQLMNRIATVPGLVFVGATNWPERIDPAIRRSGRIDRTIHVGLPDLSGLREILDLYLARDTIPDSTRDALARRLLGLSGADVESMFKRARSLARASNQELSGDHLRRIADAVTPPGDPAALRRIAVHEAGHALVAHEVGRTIRRVVIHSTGGATESRTPSVHTFESATENLAICLGGRIAEWLVLGSVSSGSGHGNASDLATATDLALRMLAQWGLRDTLVYHSDTALRDHTTLPEEIRTELDTLLLAAEHRAEELLRPRMRNPGSSGH